jgi:hypothetical protein
MTRPVSTGRCSSTHPVRRQHSGQRKINTSQTCNLTAAVIEPDVESTLSLSGGFKGSYLTFFSLENRERWLARLNFDVCEANCIFHRRYPMRWLSRCSHRISFPPITMKQITLVFALKE